jgi:multidrug efflux system outer membrane protein
LRRSALIASLVAALGTAEAEGPSQRLTLPQLQARARMNDLRVREAQDELHVLEGRYREAYWAWFPKFETSLTFAGPTPEERNDGLGGVPIAQQLRYTLNFGQPGLLFRFETTAVLPVFTFGKLEALRQAGEHGVEAGEHLQQRAKDQAAFQAAEAYFGYQLARQSREALTDSIKQLDDASKTLQKMLAGESAQVTKTDSYKLGFFHKQVEARLPLALNGMDLATAAARLLGGFSPEEPLELAVEDLSEPAVQLQPLGYYLELAGRHRPELKAIRAGLAAKEKEVFIRERMFFPDFGIAGFFHWNWTTNTTRQRNPFAYDPYDDLSGGVGLVAHQTFDFPIKVAQRDQARAELDKIQTEQRLAGQAVELEVRKIYNDLRQALDRARAQADAEKRARQWATAANASFELGTTDTRDLIEALLALSMASTEKLTAWHDGQVGVRALSSAVGADVDSGVEQAR